MEKKLTDEEIVKALKFAIAQGEPDGIGFWNSDMKWCEFSMSDVLNLVNRQKEEIEQLSKDYESVVEMNTLFQADHKLMNLIEVLPYMAVTLKLKMCFQWKE